MNLFALPPVEKRDKFANFILRKYFSPRASLENDDAYCYYLSFKRTLIICAFFSLLNWISFISGVDFNFLLFKISIHGERFVYKFVMTYPFYMGLITLLGCVPFHYFMIKKICWGDQNYDPLWWNVKVNRKIYSEREIVERFGKVIFIGVFSLLGSSGLGYFYIQQVPPLASSEISFVMFLLFYPLFLGIITIGLMAFLMPYMFYKNIIQTGPPTLPPST